MESSIFYWQNLFFFFCLLFFYDTQYKQRLFLQTSKQIHFVTKKQFVFCDKQSDFSKMNFLFFTHLITYPKIAINTSDSTVRNWRIILPRIWQLLAAPGQLGGKNESEADKWKSISVTNENRACPMMALSRCHCWLTIWVVRFLCSVSERQGKIIRETKNRAD